VQAEHGVLEGNITSSGKLRISDEEFDELNTNGILGCNSGSITTGQKPDSQYHHFAFGGCFPPHCEDHPSESHTLFTQDPTNRYARPAHVYKVDRKGYASIYDDVKPGGGEDQSGKVNPSDPVLLTVKAGGKSAGKGGGNEAPQQAGAGDCELEARLPPPRPINVAKRVVG
jgi:hypothetical protein